jgi:hypothetical protein
MHYPRVLELSASYRLVCLIAATHGVAAISFVHLLRQPAWLAGGLAALALSVALSLRAWYPGRETLVLEDNGELLARDALGDRPLRLAGPVTDFGWAVWLGWHEPGARVRRSRMLLRADFTPGDWRALGLWLRHKAVSDDAA